MSDQFDQTSFAQTQPIFEKSGASTDQPIGHNETPVAPDVKPASNRPLIIMGVITVLIMSLVLTVLFSAPRKGTSTGTQPTPESSSTPVIVGPMQATIETLEKDIKAADPAVNEFPFPPVNFSLHLRSPGEANQ
jgi:hypothetical protein